MATRLSRAFRDNENVAAGERTANGYKALFAALFCNAATIEGISEETRADGLTDDYILETLYTRGAIAYDKATGLWLPFEGQGTPNQYGVTRKYRLFSTFGGAFPSVYRTREEIFIFDANAVQYGVERIVNGKCDVLGGYDSAILQNLDAVKEITLITTDDEALTDKLKAADKARRAGASVAVVPTKQKNGQIATLSTLSTGAQFLVDKLQAARRTEYEELLHLVGIPTPTEKAERLITDEVTTANAETTAYIGLMIDTFNRQAEEQGAPFRMRRRIAPKTNDNNDGRETPDGTEKTPAEGKGGLDNG